MRSNRNKMTRWLVVGLALVASASIGSGCPLGLKPLAYLELANAGVNKYLGDFTPISSTDFGDGWTKHSFDPAGGNGPVCIAGTPYSMFTRAGDPNKLLIFEQGGGACWQGFSFCNVFAEAQFPSPAANQGIWDFANPDNPFAGYSIVYMPYCDGSVFSGDNAVPDPAFGGVRHHRGLRNQSAGMDVARATFPNAKKIVLAGTSAGGVGVAGFAPFLVRFNYGNGIELSVFNDAGPVAINLNDVANIAARANDWQFGQFYPASCTECSDTGQATEIIKWRLDNDVTIREAIYETDADATNRFFMQPPFGMSQADFRTLIVTEHGEINAAHPLRYKRFFVTADTSHGALQAPLFYTQDANGFPLSAWTNLFVHFPIFWADIVEDFVPLP
jgi:hypothetical protein